MNAIKSNHEATLVIAGAGSGKTLTILGKVKYLIEHGIKHQEILCISFTNETTKSLKNKLSDMNYDIDVYTFHKL
jgi:superfamily I DNA/RNA helicase